MADVQVGKKFNNQRLILVAMLLSSAALSIVSAYETYLGLLDFMDTTVFGNIASGILTFGIQVLLFAISWSIANHLKDGFRENIFRWVIWILCAFFSGYFSYYGFFETTGGRNDDVRMAAINKEMSGIYKSVDDILARKLDAEHAGLINDEATSEYAVWKQNHLARVIDAATAPDVGDKIRKAVAEERDRLLKERKTLRDQLSPLLTEREQVRASLNHSNSQVRAMRRSKDELEAQIVILARELSDAEGDVAQKQADYDQELTTGAGPNARAKSLDLNSAKGVRNGRAEKLKQAEEDLEELKPKLRELEALEEGGENQKHLNEIDALTRRLESELDTVQIQLDNLNNDANYDFRDQAKTYEGYKQALANKDYTKFDPLVEQCTDLRQQLIAARQAADVNDVFCVNIHISQEISQLKATQKNLNDYRAKCMGKRPQPERGLTDGTDAPLKVAGVIEHLNSCVDSITDAHEREVHKSRVANMNTRRGDKVEPITVASVALFNDAQGNAVMSAVFALIVDILVLFCALVGRNVGLPERARAIDFILNKMRKPQGAAPNVEKQINIGSIEPNKQALIDSVVNDLLRQGLAEYGDDEGNQLNLLRGATIRLTQMRKREVTDTVDHLASGERRTRRTRPNRRTGVRE